MKAVFWSLMLWIALATAAAQPQIAMNGVLNAASAAIPGWPNSSIAQGSIFSIYGSGLGPSSAPVAAYPLQSTLGGVVIQVTAGNIQLNALPIFVSPGLINAILPDGTPTGAASLIVTYQGKPSSAAPFQVAANSFGIFTTTSSGWGAGIITNTNYQLYPVNSPAIPGETAVIWGTGLGASPGDDGSAPPPQIDMPDLPLSVYVGTQPATVTYRGRAAFSGEDQINFVVPAGVTGCYVPVAVQIGNIVSNFVTMPIAPAGQPCPDPTPPIPPLNVSPSRVTPITGDITLLQKTSIIGGALGSLSVTNDYAVAFFGGPALESFPYSAPLYGNPYSLPAGACTGGVNFPGFFDVLGTEVPAGTLTIAGPNGSVQLTSPDQSLFGMEIGGGSQPLFLSAGAYTVSGSGGTFAPPVSGPGVGAFSQSFTIPPPITWTNQASITTIDRSANLDITWSGGDPSGTVQITAFVGFICNANTGNQHFTIPSFVLLSIPPSRAPLTGALTLGTVSTTPFTASGISSGVINAALIIQKTVTYQ
jgi:uncharacterized protein (TIGR03437 family)